MRIVALFLLLCAAPAAAQLPTAARGLPRGTVLTAEDIVPSGTGGQAGTAELPVGWITRRVVAAGEPLRAPTIAARKLISVGDSVQIMLQQGGFQLRMKGRALGSAGAGERVLVHVDARRRLEGVAVGPGLVRLETTERRR